MKGEKRGGREGEEREREGKGKGEGRGKGGKGKGCPPNVGSRSTPLSLTV